MKTAQSRAGSARPGAGAEGGGREFKLHAFLPYRLNRLAGHLSKALSAVYQERFDLSIPQWRVLATLQAEPDLTARDLVAATSLDKVSVSRALAGLVDRGLVQRSPHRHDARSSILRLSRRGTALFRRIAPLALAREADWLAPLSRRERDQFLQLLGKLESGLQIIDRPPARSVSGARGTTA
ncbi:MAG: MarR family winged helix-turn-helix transcriptional regulator [Pseudomonadota bacterium]